MDNSSIYGYMDAHTFTTSRFVLKMDNAFYPMSSFPLITVYSLIICTIDCYLQSFVFCISELKCWILGVAFIYIALDDIPYVTTRILPLLHLPNRLECICLLSISSRVSYWHKGTFGAEWITGLMAAGVLSGAAAKFWEPGLLLLFTVKGHERNSIADCASLEIAGRWLAQRVGTRPPGWCHYRLPSLTLMWVYL